MKTEQELFVKKYREVFNVDKSLFVNDDGEFTDSFCQSVHEMWQASAQRQGYKLVPVEPTQEVIDKFPEVLYQDTYAGECSMWIDDETIRLGYKAMIGAAE